MESIKLRELFTEMPYACALYQDYLHVRCSSCFEPEAKTSCDGGACGLVYCNETCRETDRINHTYECAALKSQHRLSSFVRLVTRILTRRRVDGGIVHLAENFPKNILDRCLSDLMSHRRDIGESRPRAESMMSAWRMFKDAFDGTPIMDTFESISRMYCVALINCFSVSGDPDMKKGHTPSLGLGFYINTSRFNHSCRPDLFVSFRGARIVIEYPCTHGGGDRRSKPADDEEQRRALTKSAQRFNHLTINYGYSSTFTTDSFFPLRHQRRESLAYGYYFQCQCALCNDDRETNLEQHAAALECLQCAEPFVWKKVTYPSLMCCIARTNDLKYACHKSCKCSSDAVEMDDAKTYARSLNPRIEYKPLEEEFRMVMKPRIQETEAQEIVNQCEPILMKARYFWHRSGNLRMAHLNERLFVAYASIVVTDWRTKKQVDYHILKMGIETGEAVIKYCDTHKMNASYHTIAAAYAYRLARLYAIAAQLSSWSRHVTAARSWCSYAVSIWEMHPDDPKYKQIVAQIHDYWQVEAKNLEHLFNSEGSSEVNKTATTTDGGSIE